MTFKLLHHDLVHHFLLILLLSTFFLDGWLRRGGRLSDYFLPEELLNLQS